MRPLVLAVKLLPALLPATLFAAVGIIPQPASVVSANGGTWNRSMGLQVEFANADLESQLLGWTQAALRSTSTPETGVAWRVAQDLPLDSLGPEGYVLVTGADGWSLRAATYAGLYYGVQSARQLLAGGGSVEAMRIADAPRSSWRGVMYDHARNFLGTDYTKRLIDQMGALKLNRLHVHLTDDQGWRIEIEEYPALTTTGASSSTGGQATWGYFSRAEWAELDEYARWRGVVLVPEIDLPGHTHAAKSSYPSVGCGASSWPYGWPYAGVEVGFSYLCNDNAGRDFIRTVLASVGEITSGEFIHIGGDECLSQNSADYDALVAAAEQAVNAMGKTAMGWAEINRAKSNGSTIIQKWQQSDYNSYTVWVNSVCSYFYLDHPEENSTDGYQWSTWCTQGGAIPTVALYTAGHGSLGVEGAMFSEYNTTAEIAENKLFPRLVALAENGWTPNEAKSYGTFASNLSALGESFFRAVVEPTVPPSSVDGARPRHALAEGPAVEYSVFTVNGVHVVDVPAEEGVSVVDALRGAFLAPGSYAVRVRHANGAWSSRTVRLR